MLKFLILHNADKSARDLIARTTPEEMQSVIKEWLDWKAEAEKTVKIEFGMPLQVAGRVAAGGESASDSTVTGYSIVEAESKEAVMTVLRNHPHLKRAGATLDVLEIVTMPGLPEAA